MNDIVAKIIIKVYLVSGKEMTHMYEVPTSAKKFAGLIKDMVDRTMALGRDSVDHLYFENPSITYNINNVEGVEMSSIGVKELESSLRKAQSRIGLIKQ